MKVLVVGASGLIGRALCERLLREGHEPRRAGRGQEADVRIDLARAPRPQDWLPHLEGIDAAVNAAGIFREAAEGDFDAVHTQGPVALFEACARAGVGRVVQVSALGADAQASSRFHLSKRAADARLRALPLQSVILQPSLVYAEAGASTRLFLLLASLPLLPRPGAAAQPVQPIHIDDAALACARALTDPWAVGRTIALAGPVALPFIDYLRTLRAGLGLPAARVLPLPAALVRPGLRALALASRLPLDEAAFGMLERGNVAPPGTAAELRRLLGRAPRPPAQFVPSAQAADLLLRARLAWLAPLLRASLALVWLITAWVSAFAFPREQSYALLADTGVPAALQPPALYGAAALDALLGIATLLRPRKALWLAQMALVAFYSVVIALCLPAFLIHPYGPILKNLPILALLLLLYFLEDGGARPPSPPSSPPSPPPSPPKGPPWNT
jgi:uncharacterized protein YbjT (DUF2867 family)